MRHFMLALLVLLAGCSGPRQPSAGDRKFERQTLNVFNWSDYIDPALIEEFEKRTGARVQYDTYASDAELEAKLLTGNSGYDVIFPSDRSLPLLIKKQLIAKLDREKLPNLRHIDPRYVAAPFDPKGEYAAPYFTGTVAVGIRTDHVTAEVKGFEVLFDPRYKGHITLLDDPEHVVAMAMLYLGHPMNSTEPKHLEDAERLLVKQRDLVQAYTSDDYKERLIRGDTWVALGWSGDLLQARREDAKINVILPESGTMLWVDAMCLPATSKRGDLAHAFIDFLLEPENAAKNATFVRYATPNLAGQKLLEDELRSDPVVYLSDSMADRCQWLKDRGAEVEKIERVWQAVRNP